MSWSPTSSATTRGSARTRKASSGSGLLPLFGEVWEAEIEPTIISSSVGMSACAKGRAASRQDVDSEVEGNVFGYCAGITPCAKQAVAAGRVAPQRDVEGQIRARRHLF